jgi:hypothetical protein
MANIIGRLTNNEVEILQVDAAPAAAAGTSAGIGSIALFNSGSVGTAYIKTGAADTAWDLISSAAASGIINAGVAGRLPVYSSSGNVLGDSYSQNTFNMTVAHVPQATRSAAIVYSIPNPGDAITAALFILSEGNQTINGSKIFSSSVDLNNQRLLNVADPTAAQDAATKSYVDAIAQGIKWKQSVRVATTANITLSGPQTIDGVSAIAGDRVLVKNQSTGSQNGIYVVAAGAWTRALDMDIGTEAVSASVYVDEGTLNADTGWVQTANAPITLGTTALTFVQFSGVGTYTAGNGLSLTGTQFSINLATNSGLQFSSGALDHFLDGTTLSKSATGIKVAAGGITNTEVAAAAAIARTKIASGTANHVVINDASGVLSSEARLALSRTADGTLNTVLVAQGAGNNPAYQLLADANIAAAAGIARNKLAALTANKLMITDGSGFDSVSAGSGFVKVASGTPSYQASISLTADVSGILPIANGGTNSSAALANNRIMISSGGAVVEQTALTSGKVIYTDANGLPAVAANFAWDNTNTRLAVGAATATRTLDITGTAIVRGAFRLEDSTGAINAEWIPATVNTTDSTVTTLQTIAIPTNTTVWIETTIVARRTGGTGGTAGDGAVYKRTSRYKNVAGTVTQFSQQSDYTSEDVGGFNAILDFSSTNARVRVTGAVNNNITWQCFTQVMTG